MLIPDNPNNAAKPSTFESVSDLDTWKKLRTDTTDRVIMVLFGAEWDEPSQVLRSMLEEFPQAYASI